MALKSKKATPVELYPAHAANIHERRLIATAFRFFPVLSVVVTITLSVYGAFRYEPLLLFLSAFFNTFFWIYMVSSAIFAIFGIRKVWLRLYESERDRQAKLAAHEGRFGSTGCTTDPTEEPKQPSPADARGADAGATENCEADSEGTGDIESGVGVTHMIVYPNYKEDEEMLAQTLQSLSEADGSKNFRVVLGMEAREGPDGEAKAERLKEKFRSKFAWVAISLHPKDLIEVHNDGSVDAEVPGKASNLKWAVKVGYEECKKELSIRLDDVVVTIADADVVFHPGYFMEVTKDYSSPHFNELRKQGNSEQIYTMWQCPQFPFRNFYLAPVPSRTWGYLASTDEFGGVTALAYGGHHMVFSGYTIPLMLGMAAQPWDGDIVAEDHHAFLRCFYYSVHAQTEQYLTEGKVTIPNVAVRPILLPAKSTSVASADGYWAGWVERYHQSRRHMQGISELCYSMLATWDTIWSLCTSAPGMLTPSLLLKLHRVFMKLFCMHILPLAQIIAFGILVLVWLWYKKQVPSCPASLSLAATHRDMFLCGLAGAWVLVWPLVVPMILFSIANYLFIVVSFVQAKSDRNDIGGKPTIWHAEDGYVPATFGSVRLTIFLMVAVDISVSMSAIAVPFTLIPELLACIHVALWGNRIKYITASKAMDKLSDYGTMVDKANEKAPKAP